MSFGLNNLFSGLLIMKRILFICSQNRLRSPTAENIYENFKTVEVKSAGLDSDAAIRVTKELVEWAGYIFVMEKSHQNKLLKKFREQAKKKRVICLNIPDEYDYMDPELIRLLKVKINRYLALK